MTKEELKIIENFTQAAWNESREDENRLWKNTKLFIMLKDEYNDGIDDPLEYLKNMHAILCSDIVKLASYYSKDHIIVALLRIKEACRIDIIFKAGKISEKEMWLILNEFVVTVFVISLINKTDKEKFEQNPIWQFDNGYSNLITIISIARFAIIIKENMDKLAVLPVGVRKKVDAKAHLFKDFTTGETEKYFDTYIKDNSYERTEDYVFNSKEVEYYLDSAGKSPKALVELLNPLIKPIIGFDFIDANKFIKTKIDALGLKLILEQTLAIEEKAFLEIFSYIVGEENNQELASVYYDNQKYIFGIFDLLQNLSALEKFILTHHHIEQIIKDEKKLLQINKVLVDNKIQQKMSAFLAYALADVFISNGYLLPTIKVKASVIPQPEIKDIINKDGQNILQGIGDIDLLALDIESKKIFVIEIKYYKPIDSIKNFAQDIMRLKAI